MTVCSQNTHLQIISRTTFTRTQYPSGLYITPTLPCFLFNSIARSYWKESGDYIRTVSNNNWVYAKTWNFEDGALRTREITEILQKTMYPYGIQFSIYLQPAYSMNALFSSWPSLGWPIKICLFFWGFVFWGFMQGTNTLATSLTSCLLPGEHKQHALVDRVRMTESRVLVTL